MLRLALIALAGLLFLAAVALGFWTEVSERLDRRATRHREERDQPPPPPPRP